MMFRQMQIKLIIFYTSIVALILVVTNLSVFFLLSTYNNYQLSRETENMLNSIQSSEWIQEDQGSIDDIIIHEPLEDRDDRPDGSNKSDDLEDKDEENEPDRDVKDDEEEGPEEDDDTKDFEKEDEVDEIDEVDEVDEVDQPEEQDGKDETESWKEDTSGKFVNAKVSYLSKRQALPMVLTTYKSTQALSVNPNSSGLNGGEREVYFPSSNELYIPAIFDAFSMYYIYAEDGTLLRWLTPDEALGTRLLKESQGLLLGSPPEVVHVESPVESYFLVVKMPIEIEGITYGYYIAARDVSIAYETVDNLARIIAISLVAGICISVLFGYIISGRIMKPIQEAYDSKQKFLADASHELRTPISIVLLSCDAMNQVADEPPMIEMIQDVKDEALRMRELVENLLILARHDSGRVVMKHNLVNVSQVIEETVKQYRYLAEEKSIVLRTDTGQGLAMKGDRQLIHSAISIIIDNAIKYSSQDGEVLIQTRAITVGRKNYVEVSISDKGRGMDAHELERVFQRFYRIDPSRTKTEEGHGLGLSIAKEVVDLHKGSIKVESTLGQGSKFTLRFKS